jgi:hypothetical protein
MLRRRSYLHQFDIFISMLLVDYEFTPLTFMKVKIIQNFNSILKNHNLFNYEFHQIKDVLEPHLLSIFS